MNYKKNIKNIQEPLFIVFEGIDGSGKSTQSKLLYDYFQENKIPCELLMEPTAGVWGKKIREILKSDILPDAEKLFKLFILDREDDVINNILPCLKSNRSVIMDRYYYSNAAYQGAMGLSPENILEENIKYNFPEPDRVYFIDIDTETALKRISSRNAKDENEIFEKKSFLEKVKKIYLKIAANKFYIIDGNQNAKKIFEKIKQDIITINNTSKNN